jgi:hypothetical protein
MRIHLPASWYPALALHPLGRLLPVFRSHPGSPAIRSHLLLRALPPVADFEPPHSRKMHCRQMAQRRPACPFALLARLHRNGRLVSRREDFLQARFQRRVLMVQQCSNQRAAPDG